MLRSYHIRELLVLTSWCLSFTTLAQFTITGKVIDATNNSPLIGATVMVQGTAIATTTNINGDFTLSGLTAPGNLRATFAGYEFVPVPFTGAGNYTVPLYPSPYDFSTIYSRKTGDWFDITTWSYVSHTGPPAYELPGATGCNVVIGAGHVITLSGDALVPACAMTIESGATLNANGFALDLNGNLNINGSITNGGELHASCFPLQINNSSATLPTFTRLIINEGGCGTTVDLNTDIVLTNGVNVISGGSFNTNGYVVYNCIPPTTSASSATYTNKSGTSMTLGWTRGNGSGGVMVVARVSGTTQVLPNPGTSYTANAAFGNGSTTGTGNYVVYSGTGSSVTITNLQPNTYYEFGVFEFNTGACYNISSFLGASDNSGCADPGSPVNPVNGAYCIGDTPPSISVASAPSGFSIEWYDSPSSSTFPSGASVSGTTNENLHPSGPGTYYAGYLDLNTNCASAVRTPVTLTQNAIASVNPLNQNICSNNATNITVSGTPSFSWIVSPNASITGASSGSLSSPSTVISQTLINSSSIQQQVTYTITPSTGCPATPSTVVVTVDPQPVLFNVSGQADFCAGSGGTQVQLSGSQNGIQYELFRDAVSTSLTKIGTGNAISFLADSPGTYTILGRTPSNCTLTMNGSLLARQINVPALGSITGNQNVCNGFLESYMVSSTDNSATFEWVVPAGALIQNDAGSSINVEFISVLVSEAKITVTAENDCGPSTPVSLQLTFFDPPGISLSLPGNPYALEPAQFNFTSPATLTEVTWGFGDGGSSKELSPEHTYEEGGTFTITLGVWDSRGCTNTATEPLTVKPPAALSNDKIKNVVTTNADNKNDYLYIEDISKFPDNEVVLLDRWGVEVYRVKGYNNEWDLKKNGEYLPSGNYVCILKLNETGEVYSRTISVIKE